MKLLLYCLFLVLVACEVPCDPYPEPYRSTTPIADLRLDYCEHYTCPSLGTYYDYNGYSHVDVVYDVVDYCCRYNGGVYYCKEDVDYWGYDGPWIDYRYPCEPWANY